MKLRQIFQVPTKTRPFFSRRKHLIVLELLHLKMEVTVSKPCDVFRVLKGSTIAAMADLWTFNAARDKFLFLNKVFSKTPYRGSCFRYIISVTPLRPWLSCIFIQIQLRRWKHILLLELSPLNQSIDPSALLSFLYMEKYTGRWADSCNARDPPVYPVDHLRIHIRNHSFDS